MRVGLILLNLALLAAIVYAVFFWQPTIEEAPLPGTYAEKLGKEIPPPAVPGR